MKSGKTLPLINDGYYGLKYSIPVVGFDKDGFPCAVIMWDTFNEGWVRRDLSDGPNPEDYDLSYVDSWEVAYKEEEA